MSTQPVKCGGLVCFVLVLVFLEEIFLWMGKLNKGDLPLPMCVYICPSSEGLDRAMAEGGWIYHLFLIQHV